MSDYLYGRNAVLEHLKQGKEAEKLFVQKDGVRGVVHRIVAMAREAGIPVIETDARKLERMSEGANHQGMVLLATDFGYSTIDEMLASAQKAGHDPLLVLLDGLTDPHNVGAIIRTAECVGADGVILPIRRSATITSTVHKVSSGATSYMKITRVTNVNQTIEQLKKENIWIYGAAGEAQQSLWQTDFSGGVCLVIGNEGEGLSELTRKRCDALVSIPMVGHLDSLNASVAASVMLYEVFHARSGRGLREEG